MAIAALRELSKSYRMGSAEVLALEDVSISLERGEFCAVMGPSGSGKSTLLNILGCLDRPSSGDYLLDGQSVGQMNDSALSRFRGQSLGFIFQSFNLIHELNVLENIEVPLFYQNTPAKQARERATALATQVGLGERLHHRPAELSGGQQQRVAIARALVNDPVLILADEPTGNLDSQTGEEIMALLCDMHRRGSTIITVTHEETVARHAQKILTMRDGRVVEVRSGRTPGAPVS